MYVCVRTLHEYVSSSGTEGGMMGQGSCRLDPFTVGYMGKGYPRLPLWGAERIGHAREAAQRTVAFSGPPNQALRFPPQRHDLQPPLPPALLREERSHLQQLSI